MSLIVHVSRLGSACLPEKFSGAAGGEFRLFAMDKDVLNQARRYLKNGGNVVFDGSLELAQQVVSRLLDSEYELLPRTSDARGRKLASRQLRQRMLTLAGQVSAGPGLDIAGLLGERDLPPLPLLIPIQEAAVIAGMSETRCVVPTIASDLLVHPDVLAPKSEPTLQLVCSAIRQAGCSLPVNARVLDMGCGSGVLTIAAWQLLRHLAPQIMASDILPEALATTRLNVERLAGGGQPGASAVQIGDPGDLFQQLSGQRFDLIIFNAPWVVAPAHNRAELALNDPGQQTIRRFLEQCPGHLNSGGQVVVGYADNSGSQAIINLERLIDGAGLRQTAVLKDRIKTYRAKRSWQSIYAYLLESR